MMPKKRWVVMVALLLIWGFFALSSSGTREATAKLPGDIKGYSLEALKDGSKVDSGGLARGKALMLVFATPT